jgi:hypothetical protein
MPAILKKLCDFATIQVQSVKRISETQSIVDGRQKRTQRPPGNANAFRHGVSAIQRRRADGELTDDEQDVRACVLAGLIAYKEISRREKSEGEMVARDGIEPPTRGFSVLCSTD